MRVRVKICGITSVEDALLAVDAGADAIGFIFAPSPRQVSPETAAEISRRLPPFVTRVGVVVDQDAAAILEQCSLDAVQFHGSESPDEMRRVRGARRIRAVRVKTEADLAGLEEYAPVADAFLLDTFVEGTPGGTGHSFDWSVAASERARSRPLILAGGLTPENVAEAVRRVMPYAVDVSSGVEREPGKKDAGKVAEFIRAAREAGLGADNGDR